MQLLHMRLSKCGRTGGTSTSIQLGLASICTYHSSTTVLAS